MTRKIVKYPGAFPLSKAVLHDQKYTMEISGIIGIDFNTGKLAEGIENQTKQIFENIKQTLEEVGWGLSNITKTRIYLLEMKDYEKMNEIYEKQFTKEYPARAAFSVKELPAGALVEIECTASGNEVKD